LILAFSNPLYHVLDVPWPGFTFRVLGMPFTVLSGGIISILIAGIALVALIVPAARKPTRIPKGIQNILEGLVIFVRDTIARPALHEKAENYLPFLCTIFVFVLTLNLTGLLPLEAISLLLGINHAHRIGGTPTAIPTVGAALAALAVLAILGNGLRRGAHRFHEHYPRAPMPACWLMSPVSWFLALAPNVPGAIGKVVLLPMAVLELISASAKCVALMVRLCANMLAGHMLLAVLAMLALMSVAPLFTSAPSYYGIPVVPLCLVGSVVLTLMEILIAGIQAFIFTIMTALFLGMYAEADH
jgi:F-type H+-transporting ATPase subunit a